MNDYGGHNVKRRKDPWAEGADAKKTSFFGELQGSAAAGGNQFDFFADDERLASDDANFDPTEVFLSKNSKKPDEPPISVKHSAPVSLVPSYATDAEVRSMNFLSQFGIQLSHADEVDLDDTSCEEEENGHHRCNLCTTASFEDDVPAAPAVKRPTELPDDVSASTTSTASSYNPLRGSSQLLDNSELIDDDLAEKDDDDDDDDIGGGGSSQAEEDDDSQSLVHGGGKIVAPPTKAVPARASVCKCAKAGGHGSANRMNGCFLCRWGNRTADAVENNHMSTLMAILDRHIGDIPPKFIALVMHAYYNKVIRREAAAVGRFLPVWRSKQIFVCITTHNYRPEMRVIHDIETLTTLEGRLTATLYKKDPEGNIEPSLATAKRLLEVMKMKWSLYSLPLTKMNFNSGTDQTAKLFGGNNPRYKSIELAPKRRRISALPGSRGAN
jgi:hypothetical protein